MRLSPRSHQLSPFLSVQRLSTVSTCDSLPAAQDGRDPMDKYPSALTPWVGQI